MGAAGCEPILARVEEVRAVELLSGSGGIDVLRAVGLLLDPGIVGLDADGRVLLANEPARRLLGLPLVEGSDFVAAEVDYRLIRLLDAARESGHVEERAITLHDRDFNARAIALTGEVATLLMVRDETRVHHLERVRRDFVSNVSHELRTPITAVQLIAETLANGGLEDPEAAADFVRRIGQEASHMAQMVEELLELSTIESGLRPMASERVPIAGLMGSLDRLRPLAESKGVSLDVSVAPGTPDLFGDASHLGQVLRNLAHNAIKFTPSGGQHHRQRRFRDRRATSCSAAATPGSASRPPTCPGSTSASGKRTARGSATARGPGSASQSSATSSRRMGGP